jgi:uncharacterized Rossmann fold enzyme
MRTRSTKARIAELTRWIKSNKNASSKKFVSETGGTPMQLYKIRKSLGITKSTQKRSAAMKEAILRKKQAIVPQAEQATLDFVPKETVVVEGNTPDFIWYEMDLLQRKLSDISARLTHVMKVSQARDADQKKMMRDLITENTELRVNNSSLKQQVTELTEMINGTPV